jgi:hypothetical protein
VEGDHQQLDCIGLILLTLLAGFGHPRKHDGVPSF